MTITLPNDPSIGDGYDPVPGNNNSAPPTGAPEGNATSTVNDIQRVAKRYFGYEPDAGTAVIGDRIWSDANGDGVQDPGEPGIGGVVHNAPDVVHAMRATSAPLLAVWCLWFEGRA